MSWVCWNVNPAVFIILNRESTASLLQTSWSKGGQAGQQNKSWPWKTLRGMQVHKHLTYRPPGLCILQRTHGVSPQRVHFITNIDWIMSSQTDWPCPITLLRLWMKNIHLMSGLVGWEGWRTHTHTHTHLDVGPPGDWYTGLTGERRGIKRTEGGARKKEKCLLNDIPIVSRSRTMALCKTANNEHRRNPLSYRGPAACSPLP